MIKRISDLIKLKAIRVTFLSLLSVIIVRAINLISIPIFSRLLTTTEYGNADIFFSYANIFMIILGLDTQGAVSKAKLDFRDDSDTYMSTNLIFTAGFACIVAVLANVFFTLLQGIIGLNRFETNLMLVYSYALYLIAFRTSENIFDYQYKKNMIMSGTASLLNLIISIILVLTAFDKNRQSGRIIGAAVPTILCSLIVYIYICKRGKWIYKREHIHYALKFSVPLIPHNLSHIILASADRIMIKNMISASDAGIYSLSYNLGMLLIVISEGMNHVFSPWLFRRIDKGETDIITKVQRLYLLIYVVITIAVMAISPEIVKIIGSHEYWDGARIVIWVVYAVFLNFTYTLYVNVEFFYRKSNWISTGTIAAAVINCSLNILYLKKYGYVFGAYSTVISYAALLLFHMFIVNCVLKKHYTDNRFVITVVLIMLFISYVMNSLIDLIWYRIILGIVAISMAGGLILIITKKQGGLNLFE